MVNISIRRGDTGDLGTLGLIQLHILGLIFHAINFLAPSVADEELISEICTYTAQRILQVFLLRDLLPLGGCHCWWTNSPRGYP